MRNLPRLGALLSSAALALGLAVGTAAPASAELIASGVYSVSYSSELYRVDRASDSIILLDYDEWRALGFPQPKRAQTEWVKYPWSGEIYAVSAFGTQADEKWWRAVTYAEWKQAGLPAPRTVDGTVGQEYFTWETSADVFVYGGDGVTRKLNHAQWSAVGRPAPTVNHNQGFITYSWNPTIAFMWDLDGGEGYGLTYAEWRREAFPTPRVVTRVPGDEVYQQRGSAEIRYVGPGIEKGLTFAEWQAMGAPAPTING